MSDCLLDLHEAIQTGWKYLRNPILCQVRNSLALAIFSSDWPPFLQAFHSENYSGVGFLFWGGSRVFPDIISIMVYSDPLRCFYAIFLLHPFYRTRSCTAPLLPCFRELSDSNRACYYATSAAVWFCMYHVINTTSAPRYTQYTYRIWLLNRVFYTVLIGDILSTSTSEPDEKHVWSRMWGCFLNIYLQAVFCERFLNEFHFFRLFHLNMPGRLIFSLNNAFLIHIDANTASHLRHQLRSDSKLIFSVFFQG